MGGIVSLFGDGGPSVVVAVNPILLVCFIANPRSLTARVLAGRFVTARVLPGRVLVGAFPWIGRWIVLQHISPLSGAHGNIGERDLLGGHCILEMFVFTRFPTQVAIWVDCDCCFPRRWGAVGTYCCHEAKPARAILCPQTGSSLETRIRNEGRDAELS